MWTPDGFPGALCLRPGGPVISLEGLGQVKPLRLKLVRGSHFLRGQLAPSSPGPEARQTLPHLIRFSLVALAA